MGKVKIGVIGAGTIAEVAHLPNYQNNADVELVAIADINVDRAEKMAAKYNIGKAYGDAEEMLKNESLDAVSICTSNSAHIPLAKLAIEHGLDVLVEKPIGTSTIEADELVALAEEKNQICMVGMTHRYRNDSQVLKDFVEEKDLGEIYYTKAKILRRRGTPTGWFTDSEKAGAGPLMDIGVHALDLAWWIIGQPEPEKVSGFLKQGLGNYQTKMQNRWESSDTYNVDNAVFDVEDFASALIRFKDGSALSLEVSWALHGAQDDAMKVDVYGTKGGVSLDPLCYYSEKNQYVSEAKLDIAKNDPMKTEIDHFISCVQNRTTPISTAAQGAVVLKMLEGIKESSAQNQEIALQQAPQQV